MNEIPSPFEHDSQRLGVLINRLNRMSPEQRDKYFRMAPPAQPAIDQEKIRAAAQSKVDRARQADEGTKVYWRLVDGVLVELPKQ
jgi:hypothetical protein